MIFVFKNEFKFVNGHLNQLFMKFRGAGFLICILMGNFLFAQDSSSTHVKLIPSKYFETVNEKAYDLQQKLDRKSERVLEQMIRQEEKMKVRLAGIDSLAAISIFGDIKAKYKTITGKLESSNPQTFYVPLLDTLKTSLTFLDQNNQFVSQAIEAKEKLKKALSSLIGFEGTLQRAEEIKKFLKERRQYLKNQLSKFGFAKELKKLNKQTFYYAEQVKEYKAILNDPRKIERKAIDILLNTAMFRKFMRNNSILASMFRLPDSDLSGTSLAGLQTRSQVNSLIQQQFSGGGANAQSQFQQNMQAAQSQLQQLKNKIIKSGMGSSDDEFADAFKPNNQKTKSFLKRIECGTNIQTTRSSSYFPVTSDLGLSLGYKLNDKSIIGIGASYKMGWGRGWRNISISHQGVGFRSFLDWKLKGNLFISGGYEQNYRETLVGTWQQSGLIGLSKSVPIKTKLFKKTGVKILWDFLSYRQIPRTQPILIRIGYNIN